MSRNEKNVSVKGQKSHGIENQRLLQFFIKKKIIIKGLTKAGSLIIAGATVNTKKLEEKSRLLDFLKTKVAMNTCH